MVEKKVSGKCKNHPDSNLLRVKTSDDIDEIIGELTLQDILEPLPNSRVKRRVESFFE